MSSSMSPRPTTSCDTTASTLASRTSSASSSLLRGLAFLAVLLVTACAAPRTQQTAAEARAMIAGYIPASVADKEGWAADIHSAMAVLEVPVTPDNVCAVVSLTEQES